jgi:hypothetical protein
LIIVGEQPRLDPAHGTLQHASTMFPVQQQMRAVLERGPGLAPAQAPVQLPDAGGAQEIVLAADHGKGRESHAARALHSGCGETQQSEQQLCTGAAYNHRIAHQTDRRRRRQFPARCPFQHELKPRCDRIHGAQEEARAHPAKPARDRSGGCQYQAAHAVERARGGVDGNRRPHAFADDEDRQVRARANPEEGDGVPDIADQPPATHPVSARGGGAEAALVVGEGNEAARGKPWADLVIGTGIVEGTVQQEDDRTRLAARIPQPVGNVGPVGSLEGPAQEIRIRRVERRQRPAHIGVRGHPCLVEAPERQTIGPCHGRPLGCSPFMDNNAEELVLFLRRATDENAAGVGPAASSFANASARLRVLRRGARRSGPQ